MGKARVERWKGVGKVRVRRRRDGSIISWRKVESRKRSSRRRRRK